MEKKKLRAVIYARKSKKVEDNESIKNQIAVCTEYVDKQGWDLVNVFIDDGVSGAGSKTHKRVSYLKMLEEYKDYDIIVCKELARFSRSILESIKTVNNLLSKNIHCYFLIDNLNSVDNSDMFIFRSTVAELEVMQASRRQKSTVRHKQTLGEVTVASNPNYGYDYCKDTRRFKVNVAESVIVKDIFNMYIEGYGCPAIAKTLNEKGVKGKKGGTFATNTIRQMLTNRVYNGDLVMHKRETINANTREIRNVEASDWIIHSKHHEAIIDDSIFNKVQEIFNSRSKKAKNDKSLAAVRHSNISLFSNLVFCSCCNSSFIAMHKKKYDYKTYYNCSRYNANGLSAGHKSIHIWESDLIEIVVNVLQEYAADNFKMLKLEANNITVAAKDNKKELDSLDKQIVRVSKKKSLLLDLLLDEEITKAQFKERDTELMQEIEFLEETKKSLVIASSVKEVNTFKIINNIKELLKFKDFTNAALRQIIEKIEVDDNKNVKVYLLF